MADPEAKWPSKKWMSPRGGGRGGQGGGKRSPSRPQPALVQDRRPQTPPSPPKRREKADASTYIKPEKLLALSPHKRKPQEAAASHEAFHLLNRGLVKHLQDWMLDLSPNDVRKAFRLRDEQGLSLVHEASRSGGTKILALLLEFGEAREVAPGPDGETPLHHAFNKQCVELLVSSGFEVNARDEYGQTPLHWAATRGHKDTIEALLAHGADSNLVDHGLYKPIGLATKPKIRRLLAPSLLPTYNLAGSNSTDGLAFVRFFDERPGEQKSLVDLAAAACWNVHNKGKDWLNKVPRDLLERLEKIRVQTCCVCGRVCNPAFTTVVEYKVRYLSQETGKPEEYDWRKPELFCTLSCAQVPLFHRLFQRAARLDGNPTLVLNFGEGHEEAPTLFECYEFYQNAIASLLGDSDDEDEDDDPTTELTQEELDLIAALNLQ